MRVVFIMRMTVHRGRFLVDCASNAHVDRIDALSPILLRDKILDRHDYLTRHTAVTGFPPIVSENKIGWSVHGDEDPSLRESPHKREK